MYETVYVPVDNSEHSDVAVHLAVDLARAVGAKVVGSHIYAAKLHDVRFKQMEFTLPDEYKEPTELEKQRKIHDALIARGLELISESYLTAAEKTAQDVGVEFESKWIDGRNFAAIVDDVEKSDYDLIVLGALGQGAVRQSTVGSVCERVLRCTRLDTLVIRDLSSKEASGEGSIVVALDGSPWSWGALRIACAWALKTAREGEPRAVEIVTVLESGDPAEELLETHARLARQVARDAGVTVRLSTLDGEPAEALLAHVERTNPAMVVVGRRGIDASGDDEVGSLPEALIRHSASNVLIVVQRSGPGATLVHAAA